MWRVGLLLAVFGWSVSAGQVNLTWPYCLNQVPQAMSGWGANGNLSVQVQSFSNASRRFNTVTIYSADGVPPRGIVLWWLEKKVFFFFVLFFLPSFLS
jgi:hypothetical protein